MLRPAPSSRWHASGPSSRGCPRYPPSPDLSVKGTRNCSEKGGFNHGHLSPSVRHHKGLSFRPVRLRSIISLALAALIAATLLGCSRKAENLVGAGRLIRGPGGLGTTVRVAPIADRDTYVEPGTADFGTVLIVGTDTAFVARIFMAVASWKVPSDTLPGFTLGGISLEVPRDTTLLDVGTVNARL